MIAPVAVTMEVPTDPSGVRLCRLLVAGVADELDLDVAAVEDLRLAVDELAYLVVDADEVPEGPLRVRVASNEDRLLITGEVAVPNDWESPTIAPDSLQARILDRITDGYETVREDTRFVFRFESHALVGDER